MFHRPTERERKLFQQEGLREYSIAALSKEAYKVPFLGICGHCI